MKTDLRWMTDEEIRRSWRLAKDRDRQIRILAQLNVMTKDEIRNIIFPSVKKDPS